MKMKAIIVLLLCAIFLFYKYIAQLFPSLISSELMLSYGYDGVMLAVMASSYYYSYTFMQVFSGLLIDRYSIKPTMIIAIFLIATALLVFTHTHNFYLMCASRALMGIGASFATILYIKCAALYTNHKTFGIISSFLATATMLGAACGGTPVSLLFDKLGWHDGLNIVSAIGFVMIFLVFILLKSKPKSEEKTVKLLSLSPIKEVIGKKDNWMLLIYSGLTFSPVAILGGLWGIPFLMTKYNVNELKASVFMSTMFVGLAVGAPLWALLSAKIQSKKSLMHFSNVTAFLALLGIIYCDFSYEYSLCLFFIFGFSIGCFIISFSICHEINSFAIMGLSVAFINSGEGLLGSIIEPTIGYLLDASKIGNSFSLINYQNALSILPCCYVFSSIVLVFVQRKKKLKITLKSKQSLGDLAVDV